MRGMAAGRSAPSAARTPFLLQLSSLSSLPRLLSLSLFSYSSLALSLSALTCAERRCAAVTPLGGGQHALRHQVSGLQVGCARVCVCVCVCVCHRVWCGGE